MLLASCCLLAVVAGGSEGAVRPETDAASGAQRLARLRARALSKLVRRGGRPLPDGRPSSPDGNDVLHAGGSAAAGYSLASASSPEVQASHGVAGTQSETSVAVFGNHVVVGYNQVNGNRGSGAAYSSDGGLTYTDNGGLPVGGILPRELLGDPSVTVCGDGIFYYSSIYFPNATDSALSVSVGTFSGTTLGWSNPKIAVTSGVDFIDKEWLTCDR